MKKETKNLIEMNRSIFALRGAELSGMDEEQAAARLFELDNAAQDAAAILRGYRGTRAAGALRRAGRPDLCRSYIIAVAQRLIEDATAGRCWPEINAAYSRK